MEISIFLAKFLGLYMLIASAIWLIRRESFETAVRDIHASNGIFSLAGVLQILAGLAIVISHDVWELNWRVIITLIGYLLIIQGVLRLAFPKESKIYLMDAFEKCHWLWLALMAFIGLVLFYFGFFYYFKPLL